MHSSNKVSQAQFVTASGRSLTALHFAGDISAASREAVVGTYAALNKSADQLVLLDFTGVDYLNSSGIALVIEVLMEAKRVGHTVAICGLTSHFTKVFTMVGITRYATLYADQAAALAAL